METPAQKADAAASTFSLVTAVVLGLYFTASVVAMISRRNVVPVKYCSVGLVCVSGLGGYIVMLLLALLPSIIGPTTYPCIITFWSFILMIPVYCFPFLIMCIQLNDKYTVGEVLLLLSKEKEKERGQLQHDLIKITKTLKAVKFRGSVAGRALILSVVTLPVVFFAFLMYGLSGGQYNVGNTGCTVSNSVLFMSMLLSLTFTFLSIFLLRKIKRVQDEFGIKNQILNAYRVILVFSAAYAVCLVPSINDYLYANLFDPGFIIVYAMPCSHFMVCVYPTLQSFGFSCVPNRGKLNNNSIANEKTITLEMVLEDEVGMASFTQHLLREFSVENIQFWREVNEYRTSALLEPEKTGTRSAILVDTYIKEGSVSWVNIPDGVRKNIEENCQKGNVNAYTFDAAQAEILNLMIKDSFPRYKRGALFKKYMADKRAQSTTAFLPRGGFFSSDNDTVSATHPPAISTRVTIANKSEHHQATNATPADDGSDSIKV